MAAVNLKHRLASKADVDELAAMNHCLIRDEGHRNPMNFTELQERMRGWLESGRYTAVIFEADEKPVGYGLYREVGNGVYLRQFYIRPEVRRRGFGRAAMELLRNELLREKRITLEVLCNNARAREFWRALGFQDYAVTMELE